MTGWYPDPGDSRQLRWWDGYRWTAYTAAYPPHQPPPPELEAAVAAMRQQDARPWGWRPVVVPITALVAIIVLGRVVGRWEPEHGSGRVAFVAVGNLLVEGLLAVALYVAGRAVAARYGGWGPTFGWRRPRVRDFPVATLGFLASLAMRLVLGVILAILSGGAANEQAENVHLSHVDPITVVFLVLVAVVAAPLTEELMFRGLLLRTFMRRWSFWPSAFASTAIFGLFHTYEVGTLLGALTLALTVGLMGLVNCYLVRVTNRLFPGILVHAASNALAVLVVVLTA